MTLKLKLLKQFQFILKMSGKGVLNVTPQPDPWFIQYGPSCWGLNLCNILVRVFRSFGSARKVAGLHKQVSKMYLTQTLLIVHWGQKKRYKKGPYEAETLYKCKFIIVSGNRATQPSATIMKELSQPNPNLNRNPNPNTTKSWVRHGNH